ncbi:MAG: hypothetical protein ACP5Q4_03565 [Candidatus Caldatribacteriaceae bacterium]
MFEFLLTVWKMIDFIPKALVPGVASILNPALSWNGHSEYEKKAQGLVRQFENQWNVLMKK